MPSKLSRLAARQRGYRSVDVRDGQPGGDTGAVGYSPYRKFKARTGDYVMVVAAGLAGVGLLAWAFLTGQFRDIEKAKFEMLERCEEQDRSGKLAEGEVKLS